MQPETRYAKSGDLSIAYQVVGDGPLDVVLVPGGYSNLDILWEEPYGAPLEHGWHLSEDFVPAPKPCSPARVEAARG